MSYIRSKDWQQSTTSRVKTLAFVSVTLLAITGCATGSNQDSENEGTIQFSADTPLNGELEIMGFNRDADEVASVRTDLGEKTISPVSISAPGGELDTQQLLSAIAADQAPDLIYANRDQLGSLAARGAIMSLDQCVEGEGIQSSDFLEPAMQQVTFDGQIYGIPEFNQVQIVMANSDLLAKAGVTLEDVDGTDLAQLSEASNKLRSHAALPMKKRFIHHFQTPWHQCALRPLLVLHMQPNAEHTLSL